jgi:hypothetical protein
MRSDVTYAEELTRRVVRVGAISARLTVAFVTTASNLSLAATSTLSGVRVWSCVDESVYDLQPLQCVSWGPQTRRGHGRR